jgi:membrane protein
MAMKFVKEMYHRWCEHRGGALGSELLLFSILSLLPLMLSLTALLGFAEGIIGAASATHLREWVLTKTAVVIGENSPVLEIVGDLFTSSARRTLTVSALVAVYASSRAFSSMVGGLDVIYGCQRHRAWLWQRVVGLVLTVISMVLAPVVVFATQAAHLVVASWAEPLVGVGGYVVWVLWVAALYRWVPKREARFVDQLPGAIGAVALIALLMRNFGLYPVVFSSNAVFGVIGSVVYLLWFGYFASCSFYLGAELNAWRADRRTTES